MKTNAILATLAGIVTTLIIACGTDGPKHSDTTTSGKIKITVDDNYTFLADTQVSTFMALHTGSTIIPTYKSEEQAFEDLKKDSARVIMVSRDLTPAEKAYFDSLNVYPKATKVATDAIAFIVNNSNPDTNLTFGHLHYIFAGSITKWTDINKKSKLGDIQVVFDNAGSANARYVKDKFQLAKFPAYCQAANSNAEVIKYVQEHPNAIGVIGVNWISDKDDSTSARFLTQIKVINTCEAQDTSMNHEFFPPLAGWLATKDYPFSRPVYLIKREAYNGLGTGFVNFCYNPDKGQKMIYLMGLLPTNIKARVIHENVQ